MLAPFSDVEVNGGDHVELPLVQVHWVGGLLVLAVEEGEDVDVRGADPLRSLAVRLGVPFQRGPVTERDWGEAALEPRLDISGGLDFYMDAVRSRQVMRCPFFADAVVTHPQRPRHDVLSEDSPRGVADQVGGAPLPETEEIEVLIRSRAQKTLIARLAGCLDRAQVVTHGFHPSE